MDKQQIRDRVDTLDKQASDAMRQAERRERQRQNAERQQLQSECEASGGHVFVPDSLFSSRKHCPACGLYQDAGQQQLARNLGKV